MTLDGGDNQLESHVEQYERNKQALEAILTDLRLLVKEVENDVERAKEITSALHPPEDPSGEEAPRAEDAP